MYFEALDNLKRYIEDLQLETSEELMILSAEDSSKDVEGLISFANSKDIKIFGGIFPRIILGNKSLSEGFIVERLKPIFSSIVLPYLMRFKLDTKDVIGSTAIVLADGLTDRYRELTDTVYNKLGDSVKYIGGGAGYYNMRQKPCIFNNDGIHQDVIYICIVKQEVQLSVSHGWSKLYGPLKIDAANGNVLSKLNGMEAYTVYKEVIEEEENIFLYKEDFFTYAKDHPFGIVRKNSTQLVVRDPIAVNEKDEIVCVADIPEEGEVYILRGNENSLLSSSLQIAENCAAKAPKNYLPLLFDCISRAMFLEERFEEELHNIQHKLNFTVEGVVSIGEITSQRNIGIAIHNKSTVLGLLPIE